MQPAQPGLGPGSGIKYQPQQTSLGPLGKPHRGAQLDAPMDSLLICLGWGQHRGGVGECPFSLEMFHEVFRGEGQDASSLLWEVQKWTHIYLEREAANPSTMLALANLHEGPQVLHCYFNVVLASKIKGWGDIFVLISPPVCAPIPPPPAPERLGVLQL